MLSRSGSSPAGTMSEFNVVLGAVIPVFLITGAGFVLRRLAWLSAEADQSLLRLTINLLLPCLILDSALGNPALAQWRNLLLAPLIGAGTFGLGLAAARLSARFARLEDDRARRTFTLSVGLLQLRFRAHTAGSSFVWSGDGRCALRPQPRGGAGLVDSGGDGACGKAGPRGIPAARERAAHCHALGFALERQRRAGLPANSRSHDAAPSGTVCDSLVAAARRRDDRRSLGSVSFAASLASHWLRGRY